MPRTTDDAVKKVLMRDYDARKRPDLAPFVETASGMVDDLVTYANDNELTTPGGTRLELIERWLAAWAYSMADRPFSSRSTDGASGSFVGQTGMGIKANAYGQTAANLDPTGYLNSLDKAAVGGSWLGTANRDRRDWIDREGYPPGDE